LGFLFAAALLIVSLGAVGAAQAKSNATESWEPAPGPPGQAGGVNEISGQPLHILVGADGSLQVYHQKYVSGATFGDAGSGFFLAIGQTVYGFLGVAFTPISQTGPSGSGTASSPFQVITQEQVSGNGVELHIVQTVSYVNGNNYFNENWEVANTGSGTVCFKAYHAADLYFADDDHGIGYYDPGSGAVGGFNQARDWFMVFIPSQPATHYEEAYYSTIWDRVGSAENLQDAIDTDYIDNGAALQWDDCLSAGQSTTFGDRWSFGVSEAEAIQPGGIPASGLGGPAEAFRQTAPLTPRITTYIPTPLDLSFDPKVIGTNLLLAAIAMILFTIASEILNRTLARNEPFMQRLLKPVQWLRDKVDHLNLSKQIGRPIWFELLKLSLVLLIYGFVFSLLDPTWKPFSLTGLYLFVTMTIAYGLVGMADDIAQWAAARHWKLPASLDVRPGNLLLIVASTVFSRLFGILPGIMFGTPEVFDVDEAALQNRRTENSLLRLAAGILFLLLFAAWIPTGITALILSTNAPQFLLVLVGGLESFLLLIFAITVQNIFLQMLALPNTFGRALARWNKPVWALGFLAATFLFLHTLLNPRGDLVKALGSTSVVAFLVTIFLFLVFTILVWLFFAIVNAFTPKPVALPAGYPAGAPVVKKSNWGLGCLLLALVAMCLCAFVVAVLVILYMRGNLPVT